MIDLFILGLPYFLAVGLMVGLVIGIFFMIVAGKRNPDDTIVPNRKAFLISLIACLLGSVLINLFLAWKEPASEASTHSAFRTPNSALPI